VQFGLVVWVADVALAGHASPASQPSAVEVIPAVVALDPNGHWVAGDAAGTLPADRHVTRMPWWAEDARAEIAGVALTGAGYIAALVLFFADRVRRRLGAGAQLVDVTVLAPGSAWVG